MIRSSRTVLCPGGEVAAMPAVPGGAAVAPVCVPGEPDPVPGAWGLVPVHPQHQAMPMTAIKRTSRRMCFIRVILHDEGKRFFTGGKNPAPVGRSPRPCTFFLNQGRGEMSDAACTTTSLVSPYVWTMPTRETVSPLRNARCCATVPGMKTEVLLTCMRRWSPVLVTRM